VFVLSKSRNPCLLLILQPAEDRIRALVARIEKREQSSGGTPRKLKQQSLENRSN